MAASGSVAVTVITVVVFSCTEAVVPDVIVGASLRLETVTASVCTAVSVPSLTRTCTSYTLSPPTSVGLS